MCASLRGRIFGEVRALPDESARLTCLGCVPSIAERNAPNYSAVKGHRATAITPCSAPTSEENVKSRNFRGQTAFRKLLIIPKISRRMMRLCGLTGTTSAPPRFQNGEYTADAIEATQEQISSASKDSGFSTRVLDDAKATQVRTAGQPPGKRAAPNSSRGMEMRDRHSQPGTVDGIGVPERALGSTLRHPVVRKFLPPHVPIAQVRL